MQRHFNRRLAPSTIYYLPVGTSVSEKASEMASNSLVERAGDTSLEYRTTVCRAVIRAASHNKA